MQAIYDKFDRWMKGDCGQVTMWKSTDGKVSFKALIRDDGKILSTIDGVLGSDKLYLNNLEPAVVIDQWNGRYLFKAGKRFSF